MLELRALGADDWALWRELRLAALADAPAAFGSALADWSGQGDREDRWRGRLALPGSHNVVVMRDGTPVGMVSGVPDEEGGSAELISMWVHPTARGAGVGGALLHEVERWAVARGDRVLRLAVAEDNATAARLYHRHGYQDTGRVAPMPDGRRRERLLEKRLGTVAGSAFAGDGVQRVAGSVVGLARHDDHRFSKTPQQEIRLVAGIGVEGDAHAGVKARHRSRVRQDPDQPNLRQVHLLQAEFFEMARGRGHDIGVGDLGENVTTTGIDLLSLPRGTRVRLGRDAVVRLTGLRNPCWQIDDFRPGLLDVAVARDDDGGIVRRTGVMGVVEAGGVVTVGDRVTAELPPEPHEALDRV